MLRLDSNLDAQQRYRRLRLSGGAKKEVFSETQLDPTTPATSESISRRCQSSRPCPRPIVEHFTAHQPDLLHQLDAQEPNLRPKTAQEVPDDLLHTQELRLQDPL